MKSFKHHLLVFAAFVARDREFSHHVLSTIEEDRRYSRPPRFAVAGVDSRISGPPTMAEDLKMFFCKGLPGSVFGLPIYTIQLLRGAIPHKLRKTISVALAFGWTAVALMLVITTQMVASSPATGTGYDTSFVCTFSFAVMAIAGALVYNRMNYGYYL
jgi:hypothetical protein